MSTGYQTPVTITLACTDPVHPVVSYRVLAAQNGVTLSLSGNQVTATPIAEYSNIDTLFNYWGYNSIGEYGVGSVTVFVGPAPPPPLPPNDPPIARCDVYNVEAGELLRVPARQGVLANDSDPDGDKLFAEGPTASYDNRFPTPDLRRDGSIYFDTPTKPRVFSFRYWAVDARGVRSESTFTIGVGRKASGCRPADTLRPYTRGSVRATLRVLSGSATVRSGGGWRAVRGRLQLSRPLLVDSRRGSVQVRQVSETNYDRLVQTGRISGGLFKLGERGPRVPGQARSTVFTTIEPAGALGCRNGSGPGRRLTLSAAPGFRFDGLRLSVLGLYIRNRPVVSSYTVIDRCDKTSTLLVHAGRVQISDKNRGRNQTLNAGQRDLVRPRR